MEPEPLLVAETVEVYADGFVVVGEQQGGDCNGWCFGVWGVAVVIAIDPAADGIEGGGNRDGGGGAEGNAGVGGGGAIGEFGDTGAEE